MVSWGREGAAAQLLTAGWPDKINQYAIVLIAFDFVVDFVVVSE